MVSPGAGHIGVETYWVHVMCCPSLEPGAWFTQDQPSCSFPYFTHMGSSVEWILYVHSNCHPKGGVLSRLCLHPLSGHAFSSICPAQHPIPHELPTSTSAPVSAVLGTLCFHVDHSDSWVPFVEIRNGPYSFLNPSAVFILRGLRTYTREWMTCEVK